MKTTTFFQVCEWVRSGVRVMVADELPARPVNLGTDLIAHWQLVEKFTLSNQTTFIIIKTLKNG